MRILHLTSIAELRDAAAAWDDLWWQSDVALPLARAELLAEWIEQFSPRAEFHALVVADSARWIAALPLVPCRVARLIPAAGLPCNPWSPCGDLLCDPGSPANETAMDLLLSAAAEMPWRLFWLGDATPESSRWQSLLRACARAGVTSHYHQHYRVGRVEIGRDWDAYQKQLAKNHRQAMNRSARRLAAEGNVQFEMFAPHETPKAEAWLREAFEVEDLSWKGRSGSSVLRTPGMFDFFVRQAEQLAAWGQWAPAALRLDGRIIAFMHGFRAKGVCFAHKISYDPQFASLSPGQLLFYRVLEHLHADGETRAFDFLGPLTQSHMRWRPETYGVGRVAMAPRRLLGRVTVLAYKNLWRRLRDWRTATASQLHDHGVLPVPGESASPEPAGTPG